MKSSPDPLDGALAAWRISPTRNPQFRAQVWNRIQETGRVRSWFGYLRGHAAPVALAFAFALVVGVFSGRERARASLEADTGKMAAAYVRSLDARTMRLP